MYYNQKWNVDDGNERIVIKFLWFPKKLRGKIKWFQFVNIRQHCYHNIACLDDYYWEDHEFIAETPAVVEKKIGFLTGWLYGAFGVVVIGAVAYGAIKFHGQNPNASMYWINGLLLTGTLNVIVAMIAIVLKSSFRKLFNQL